MTREEPAGALPPALRRQVTAVDLAHIAGVDSNTVRKIASELLDMLKRDMENSGPAAEEVDVPRA